jgi:hypothetical protein
VTTTAVTRRGNPGRRDERAQHGQGEKGFAHAPSQCIARASRRRVAAGSVSRRHALSTWTRAATVWSRRPALTVSPRAVRSVSKRERAKGSALLCVVWEVCDAPPAPCS